MEEVDALATPGPVCRDKKELLAPDHFKKRRAPGVTVSSGLSGFSYRHSIDPLNEDLSWTLPFRRRFGFRNGDSIHELEFGFSALELLPGLSIVGEVTKHRFEVGGQFVVRFDIVPELG